MHWVYWEGLKGCATTRLTDQSPHAAFAETHYELRASFATTRTSQRSRPITRLDGSSTGMRGLHRGSTYRIAAGRRIERHSAIPSDLNLGGGSPLQAWCRAACPAAPRWQQGSRSLHAETSEVQRLIGDRVHPHGQQKRRRAGQVAYRPLTTSGKIGSRAGRSDHRQLQQPCSCCGCAGPRTPLTIPQSSQITSTRAGIMTAVNNRQPSLPARLIWE